VSGIAFLLASLIAGFFFYRATPTRSL